MSIDAGVTHRIIGTEAEVTDDSGLTLSTDAVYEDLAPFDLLYIPGGFGTRALVNDARLLDYLRTWGPERPLASVCTGSLLLGHAGYLKDRRATTHHHAYDLLRPLCREVVTDRRIVDEGPVITAGGVSSALDLGLYLVERFWGEDARTRIAAQMEYRAYAPR